MQLPAIYRERPVVAWTFTIGALIVIAWALFSRAFRSGASSGGGDTQTIALASNLPDPNAQLAAATELALAQSTERREAMAYSYEAAARAAELSVARELSILGYELDDRNSERTYNLQAQGIASNERVIIADIQAQSDRYAIAAELEAHRESSETARTALLANAQVAQSQAFASAQVSVAKQDTKKGILGTIGSIIGGIFSDANLKYDISAPIYDAHGVPWRTFRYTQEASALDNRITPHVRVTGVLAQDVLKTKYRAAVGKRSGFYTVDYSRLPQ